MFISARKWWCLCPSQISLIAYLYLSGKMVVSLSIPPFLFAEDETEETLTLRIRSGDTVIAKNILLQVIIAPMQRTAYVTNGFYTIASNHTWACTRRDCCATAQNILLQMISVLVT